MNEHIEHNMLESKTSSTSTFPRPWEVFFSAGFSTMHYPREKAGVPIVIGKEFDWAGSSWYVPTAYICGKGMVVDLCGRASAAELQTFVDKWHLSPDDDDTTEFTDAEVEQMQRENPLDVGVFPELKVNGQSLRYSHGESQVHNPLFPNLTEGSLSLLEECQVDSDYLEMHGGWNPWIDYSIQDMVFVMEHYQLDSTDGWTIWRCAFEWEKRRPKQVKSLEIRMKDDPVRECVLKFSAANPGDVLTFQLSDGEEADEDSSISIHSLTWQELPEENMQLIRESRPELEFPRYFLEMKYTLSENLADKQVFVQDACGGDRPRPNSQVFPDGEEGTGSSGTTAITMIGGSDGPTAVFIAGHAAAAVEKKTACSSLYFEPDPEITWQVYYYKKDHEDMMVTLV